MATVFPSTSGEQHETVKSDVHPKPGSTASSAASAVRSSIYIDTHALVICRQALLRLKNVESMDFDCDVMPPFSKEQSICKYQRTKINQQLPELKAKAASCPANVLNAQDFYVALRDNALSGDTEAQRCYILGYFSDRESKSEISPDQDKEYASLAPKFIDYAFERGDWKVVQSLGRARLNIQDGLIQSVYPM